MFFGKEDNFSGALRDLCRHFGRLQDMSKLSALGGHVADAWHAKQSVSANCPTAVATESLVSRKSGHPKLRKSQMCTRFCALEISVYTP